MTAPSERCARCERNRLADPSGTVLYFMDCLDHSPVLQVLTEYGWETVPPASSEARK